MLSLLGLWLAASAAVVRSSMLSDGPVTDLPPNAALNAQHPAVGADLPPDSPGLRLVEAREATNNTDLARLEAYFGVSFERDFTQLPLTGEIVSMPWPSGYWPTHLDGINHAWSVGSASPADKYARAFGLDAQAFATQVSRATGVLSKADRKPCTANADCTALKDGSVCGMRVGNPSGFCIPTWFGLCHAWAPAAILEREPKCPVVVNDVEFKPMDIKALLTDVYDSSDVPTVFTGARFNGVGNETRDKFGRHPDPRYRDLGAGFFHLAVTNILGKLRKAFVVDVSAGREVWNQPARSYKVLEETPMTLEHGAQTYFNVQTYPFNAAAASLVYVVTRFSWVTEALEDGPLQLAPDLARYTRSADYAYLLELNKDNEIIGGEWVGSSLAEHPDFMWLPQRTPSSTTVSRAGVSYKHVQEILEASVNGDCLGGAGPGRVSAPDL